MAIEKERSILTTFMEKFFTFRPKPPAYEGSTEKPFPEQPTTKTPTKAVTVSPYYKWLPKWLQEKPSLIPFFRGTTPRPLWTGAPDYERNSVRPYQWSFHDRTTVKTKIERPLIIQSGSSFGLENCLWVALGGVGVLVLMAIFMKLGRPIRRVRRQLSNNRLAPDVITVTLNPDYRNLDMGPLLRLGDSAASTDPGPVYDPPPPYIECVGSSSSINKYDSEEPPPRYSASFENLKNKEPKVHIRRQNDDNVQNDSTEDDVRVTTTSNHSDDVASVRRTELVFDKGRIVERLSLHLNSNNTET